jgi:beta-N-acetylhexosaminidase
LDRFIFIRSLINLLLLNLALYFIMRPVTTKLIASLALLMMTFSVHDAFAQKVYSIQEPTPTEKRWVDSVFQTLSEDEKIGQLVMVRAHSDRGADHVAQVEEFVRKYKVGGMCFFQGTPEKQLELTNRYQSLAKVPLMVAIDGEWGLAMRMKESVLAFPKQMMLGAIQDNDLIYRMGEEIAKQCKRVGLTVNFAPDSDVNNNPRNPVIGYRSFGEDRHNVSVKAYMYMKGMQDHGVLACAKHFPGHGDTDVDSHYDLPVIKHPMSRLDSLEFYPFKSLINYGIGGVMVAHLHVPALDDRANRPTSLSRNTVTHVLRRAMGFDGLVFTDGLEMKGVTKYFTDGIAEAEAILAGNDILCVPENAIASIEAIKRYLREGKISKEQFEASVKRILKYKYRLGLTKYTPVNLENVRKDLNNPQAEALKRDLIKNALTLLRNKDRLIPFGRLDTLSFASLSIGASSMTPFQKRLGSYVKMTHLQAEKELSAERQAALISQLAKHKVVIVGLHDMVTSAGRNFGLTQSSIDFLHKLKEKTRVVLAVFGSPYSLKHFDELDWVLTCYDGEDVVQDLAAQSLFGAFGIRGRLPVTASDKSRLNAGDETAPAGRFGYTIPEAAGISSDTLRRIELLAQEAINNGAMPGCVVLIAKDGNVVYEKAFGYHTYARERPMQVEDIFDLASITKIAATTPSVMKFVDQGRIDLKHPLSEYLPELQKTNKALMTISDIMAHNAGLLGWIPFYKMTMGKKPESIGKLNMETYYRSEARDSFSMPVAANLFLKDKYRDTIFQTILQSELRPNLNYRYSDLGFYMLADMVARFSGKPFEAYVNDEFYAPLGLQTMTFNPWKKYSIDQIPPTEEDRYFRMQRVQGYVHDMGAAMLGGVSGHAGLFGTANDLAIMMQMYLQRGYYGGHRFIENGTLQQFVSHHPRSNRRGIGFDMRPVSGIPSNMSMHTSTQTFGHTGFTGTCTWVDPEHNLVYVFLSNRTYPTQHNTKLERLDTRQRIHGTIYKAMKGGKTPQAVFTSAQEP